MPQAPVIDYLYHFDICTVFLLAIVLFSLCFRRVTRGTTNKVFIVFVCIILSTTLFDLLAMYYSIPQNMARVNSGLLYIYHSLYFLFRQANMPFYVLFILISSGAWQSFGQKNLIVKILLFWPYAVFIICLLINPFNNFMFAASSEGGYERHSGMWVMYFFAAYYMLFVIIFTVRYRKLFRKDRFIAMFSIVPLSVIAVIIQLFMPNLLVEMFATACSVLLVSITIHRPEQSVIAELNGVFSKQSFADELHNMDYLKGKYTVIIIKIRNYSDVTSYLNHSSILAFLRAVYRNLVNLDESYEFKGSIFFLEDGMFAMISRSQASENTSVLAERVYDGLRAGMMVEGVRIHIVPMVCYYSYPDVLSSFDSQMRFINSMEYLFPSDAHVVNLKDVSESKDFRLRNSLDAIVADAIKNRKFQVYYQPIYSVRKKRFISAEALIRLYDGEYGFINPELFIASAERNGTIYQIGDIVMEDVCRFISSPVFRRSGLEYIEVNLAVAQCVQPNLIAKIEEIKNKYGIRPSQINFEITERESVVDHRTFRRNMTRLNELDFSLSLDDYGTGYSNIQRMLDLPLAIVKIDKSFVDKLEDEQMKAIVIDTVRMLKDIGKEIVVEGVEDENTLRTFESLGCDFIQGYYFSKPLPEDEFVEFCRTWNENAKRNQ